MKKQYFGLVLIMMICLAFSATSHAANLENERPASQGALHWVDTENSYIYQGSEENNMDLPDMEEEIQDDSRGILDSLFGGLIFALGDGLYRLGIPVGIEMNAIIYGRVGGASQANQNVSMFQLDLARGNLYGIVAMFLFSYLRGIVMVFLILIMMYRMTAYLWSGGDGKSRDRLKDDIWMFAFSSILLIVFPKLLDFVIYVRDAVLYGQMTSSSELIQSVAEGTGIDLTRGISAAQKFFGSDSRNSMIGLFRTVADSDKGFLNATIYLGAVVLQWYMAGCYIGSAFAMVVLIVMFPIFIIFQFFDKSIMSLWLKQILGILLNPILDSCLLLIPIMFMLSYSISQNFGYTLIALITCMCLIPARGVMRQMLGIGNGMGFEVAGIGTMIGVAALARSLGRTMTRAAGAAYTGVKDASKDKENADLYSGRAEYADKESASRLEELGSDIQDLIGGDEVKKEDLKMDLGDQKTDKALSPSQKADMRLRRLGDGSAKLKHRREELQKEISRIDADTAVLRQERSGLNPNEALGRARIHEIDRTIGQNDLEKSELRERIGNIRQAELKAGETERLLREEGIQPGISGRDAPVLDRKANLDNFELPEFRNISPERKAELYRARAKREKARAFMDPGMIVTGAGLSAAAAYSAASFFPLRTQAVAAGIGMDIGTLAGQAASAQMVQMGEIGAGIIKNKINTSRSLEVIPVTTDTDTITDPVNASAWVAESSRIFAEQEAEEEKDNSDRDRIHAIYDREISRVYEQMPDGVLERRALRRSVSDARRGHSIELQSGNIPLSAEEKEEANEERILEALERFSYEMSQSIREASRIQPDLNEEEDFDAYIKSLIEHSPKYRKAIERKLRSQGILY